ncbi:GntR family transcriptional regulator [Mesorhizobium sp. L-8-10]|uniref:GntR family transcriptional regulator n=1 Tax=Mesorhizobium sp. L-8-10 TaxID=2744523 RepID=UPI001925ADBB|nr:GntR family transcriptional regulator [Mesorhizobium sp. L-8-10]BCH30129.1 GntR family transcriptional regulator [Mesorhizobium sp. L-8-10]
MSSQTLSQNAYHSIKDDIATGRIAPNTILSERDLADRLGISRTPLRSAMSRLERENVIDRLANGALLVRAITIEQLLEIVQLRQILERSAAARAAEFGPTPALLEVREAMTRYLDDGKATFDDFWRDDELFHLGVALAARMELLPELLAEQRAIVRRSTIIRTHDNFADQAKEHIAVIDAIVDGNPAAARAAMSLHFDNMRTRTLGSLSSR